jgi:Na+/alanine symporter
MTSYAFSTALTEAGNYIVTVGLIFFAFTTILRNSMEMLYGIPGRGIKRSFLFIFLNTLYSVDI